MARTNGGDRWQGLGERTSGSSMWTIGAPRRTACGAQKPPDLLGRRLEENGEAAPLSGTLSSLRGAHSSGRAAGRRLQQGLSLRLCPGWLCSSSLLSDLILDLMSRAERARHRRTLRRDGDTAVTGQSVFPAEAGQISALTGCFSALPNWIDLRLQGRSCKTELARLDRFQPYQFRPFLGQRHMVITASRGHRGSQCWHLCGWPPLFFRAYLLSSRLLLEQTFASEMGSSVLSSLASFMSSQLAVCSIGGALLVLST